MPGRHGGNRPSYPHVLKNEGYDPVTVKLPATLVNTPETRRQASDCRPVLGGNLSTPVEISPVRRLKIPHLKPAFPQTRTWRSPGPFPSARPPALSSRATRNRQGLVALNAIEIRSPGPSKDSTRCSSHAG